MRIGIDGGCLANRRGFGRFARHLLGALASAGTRHEFVLILDRPSAETVEIPAGFPVELADVREAPSRAASASGRRRLGDMLAMGRAASRAKLDLLYFPASYSFFPCWNVPRVVVTLHDTLALAHPELVFPTTAGRLAWRLKEHLAVRWADRVVTVSDASRRDVASWFRLKADRMRVITEGPASAFRPMPAGAAADRILRRYGVDPSRRFLLYVGGLSPHKNLLRLIEAFRDGAGAEDRLVLVGDLGDVFHTHVPALREAISRCGLEERILLTGFVPDADLAHLYSRAYALVQPSLMEGFGLPAVESLSCGTPVICSRAGSSPEVVGEAGRFFDPLSVESIAGAIRGLLGDPEGRDELARLAARRASRFTWEASARQLIVCFEEFQPTSGPAARMAGSARSKRWKFARNREASARA